MSEAVAPPALRARHVVAAVMGNALEFYDFLTYAFFSIQIGHAFFPGSGAYGGLMLSLGLFTAGFVMRPVGALVLGAFADRVGRRPAMMLSYTLMGSSILAMAVIPPYAMIGIAAPILALASRMAQGFSLGGEVGSNSAFLAEAARPDQRGLIISWQGASQYIAGTVGSLVGFGLAHLLPPELFDAYGWRIAFLLGGATLPFGLWLRRGLPETLQAQDAGAAPPRLQLAARHWRLLVLGGIYLGMSSIGTYVLNYFATYAQDTLHMKVGSGLLSQVMIDGVSVGVILLSGWLTDRYGRKPILFWGNLAFLLMIWPAFAWISAARSEAVLIAAPVAMAIASNMSGAAFYPLLAETLPRAIRSAGFAVAYATGVALAGGTTQFIITWLIHTTADPMAPAWYLIAATIVAQLAIWPLKESAPAKLAKAAALGIELAAAERLPA